MKRHEVIGRCAVLSTIAVLTACGGGGGSGGDDKPVSSLAYDSAGYASKTIEISSNTNIDNIHQLYTDVNDAFGLVGDLHDSLWDQSEGVSGTTDCDAGGTVKVTYAGEGWNDDETWEFNNCVVSTFSHGNVLLNGSFRYVDILTGETPTSESWKGYENYNLTGELRDTGEPLIVKGRADWDQFFSWDNDTDSGRVVDTIEAFELKVGNRYVALTDSEIRYEGTEFNVEYSMAGKLIGSSVGGYVQISTPTPIAISDYETCPTEGIMRIASDGTAEVRYGSSAGGTATAVAVWVDGQIVESYNDCSNIDFTPVY